MPTTQESKETSNKTRSVSFYMTVDEDTFDALQRKANKQGEKYRKNVTVQKVLKGIAELATSTGEFANLESEPKT